MAFDLASWPQVVEEDQLLHLQWSMVGLLVACRLVLFETSFMEAAESAVQGHSSALDLLASLQESVNIQVSPP